jgi:hypothetical protein
MCILKPAEAIGLIREVKWKEEEEEDEEDDFNLIYSEACSNFHGCIDRQYGFV